jgi:hypothetical protein
MTRKAWRVEIYWRSSIVGHLTGWLRTTNPDRDEPTFRIERKARAFAARKTGIASPLVPYMSRRAVVVETTRPTDWRDRLSDIFRKA